MGLASTFLGKMPGFFWNLRSLLVFAFFAAVVFGIYLNPRVYILAAALFAVMMLGFGLPWVTVRSLRAEVVFELGRCREGEMVPGSLIVRNFLPWSAWNLVIRDGGSMLARLDVIPGWRRTVLPWSFTPECRGVYPREALNLATSFPFGLLEANRPLASADPVIVWPRTFPVTDPPEPLGEYSPEGAVSRNKAGTHGDILGVRPYRRGDSPRRIHWGQSARFDRLIVCELQSTARPRVLLALDTDSRIHVGEGGMGSREWAIRLTASLCERWLDQGMEIALLTAGRAVPAAAGRVHRRELLDALAHLPRVERPSSRPLPLHPAWRAFRGLRVFITTDRRLAEGGAISEGYQAVFQSSAFAGPSQDYPGQARPASCWLWLDDPTHLAAQAGLANPCFSLAR